MLEINHLDYFMTYHSQTPVTIMYSDGPSIIFHLFGGINRVRAVQCVTLNIKY